MLTRPEAADPAVEERKRRARRRLVGAIVLALAAAVILPLLLESDPKPLGDDVSIQMPPIDNGKFITPLSPAKALNAKAAPDAAVSSTPPAPAASQKPTEVAPDSAVEPKPAAAIAASSKPAEAAQTTPTDVSPPTAPAPAAAVAAIPEAQTPPRRRPKSYLAIPGRIRDRRQAILSCRWRRSRMPRPLPPLRRSSRTQDFPFISIR